MFQTGPPSISLHLCVPASQANVGSLLDVLDARISLVKLNFLICDCLRSLFSLKKILKKSKVKLKNSRTSALSHEATYYVVTVVFTQTSGLNMYVV